MKLHDEDLENLAYENGYEVVTTTSGSNGYPRNLEDAIIGFETFDEAKEFARTHDMFVIALHRRDGWNLWERKGSMYEGFKVTAADYGDDYNMVEGGDVDSYFDDIINNILPDMIAGEEFNTIQELADFVRELEATESEISSADDDEWVILYGCQYYETVQKESVSWSYDTHHYKIGVISEDF